MSVLTYPEAVGVGLLQGVTELFPVSSLGHSILIPALLGGHWKHDLDVSADGSLYLNELVGLHLATALALVVYFWRDWVRIIRGLFTSVTQRRIQTVDQKLAWLIVTACVPVAVSRLSRSTRCSARRSASPCPPRSSWRSTASCCSSPSSCGAAAPASRRAGAVVPGEEHLSADEQSDLRITRLTIRQAVTIGAAQILALLPGISRSGSTISAGIFKGMGHEDSARFAFLLATPVIGGAALLKLPPLLGAQGNGLRGPLLAGSVAAFVAAYLATRYLVRYFENRTLIPFAIYCSVAGLGSLAYFTLA
ncbi:undecaprenyl-diphosphate phosphatase [Streptomyces lasalocidi]